MTKRMALWAVGGVALAAASVALGITLNWGIAAIVGGLMETAYFGLLPLGLDRRKEQRDRSRALADKTSKSNDDTSEESTMTAGDPTPRPRPEVINPADPYWGEELSRVLQALVLSVPDPVDVSQIAVQSGIQPHVIERAGDGAANRWQRLIERALIEGGNQRLNLVLSRAIQRSAEDPRLVAAVERWSKTTPQPS